MLCLTPQSPPPPQVSSSGVIKPDSWACIRGEGMPIQGRPFEKGNLYVHFTGALRWPSLLPGFRVLQTGSGWVGGWLAGACSWVVGAVWWCGVVVVPWWCGVVVRWALCVVGVH